MDGCRSCRGPNGNDLRRHGTPTGTLRASWAYDTLVKGQPTSSTRHEGNAAYVTAVTAYDDGYRPLGQSVTIPSAEGALAGTYTTTYAYMPNGQPKSARFPAAGGLNAETVTTTYDAVSLPMRLAGGIGWGYYLGQAQYSVYGQVEQTMLGNTYWYYVGNTYETGTNRLTGTWLNREVAPTTYDLSLTYTYDQAGNPTSITDAPTTGAGDAQCFTYDGQRRLTQAWTPANANCATAPSTAGLGGAAPYWFTDTFDPVGNRTERVEHGVAGDTTHTYTYPAAGTAGAHTLTAVTAVGPDGTVTNTYGYDDAGNTTTRTVGEDPDQTLTWDPEGELATLAETGGASDSYLYTADGDRLVRHQDDATTVYLPGGQELTLAAGQVKATRYYAFNGTTVAVRTARGNAGVTTLISDHHGTAQLAIHNTTNAVTRKYTDPYGNPRGTTPTTWAGDHGYLDKPEDTTGLTQVGARYYDPTIGRFISVDPVMDLTDPQQWHGYAYANNNPITNSDPTGLRPQQHDGAASKGEYRPATPPNPKPAVPAVPGIVDSTADSSHGGVSDVLDASGTTVDAAADAAAEFADLASQASQDLRGGSSEAGFLLGRFKYDAFLRIMARLGRNPAVRVVSRSGGWVTLGLIVPLDLALNYTEEYRDVGDPGLRLALTFRRTAASTAGGVAGGLLAAAGAAMICGGSAGAGCVVIGIAAVAGGGWAGSEVAGSLVDSGAMDRVVVGPPPVQCSSFDDYCGDVSDAWWDESWGPDA